ncbi:MAG: phasin family protein [Candidatus Paracaedimonas acanthamoebae]|uniref:Phasin family protein n=1 Tax=Candidatus Paracaedimonas acanthamoebae TaxID=244581 RepID=A0A8J7TUM6_9PROT|nr:phasin family protein [Candidatus Paracaedimonas acanthamoebae]
MTDQANSDKKTQNNPFEFFKDMKMPSIDYEALLAIQRKNLEAFAGSQKSTMEAIKTIAGLHQEYTKNAVEQANQTLKQAMSAKTLEEQMKVHGDAVKAGFQDWMKHTQHVGKHLTEASKNFHEDMSASVKQHMKNAQDFYEKAKKTH